MVLKLRDRILAGPGGVKRPLTPQEMEAIARSADLATLDLSGYRRFQDECYARNTVLLNDQCELVVICWQPGQMSAIHDHGSSYCLYLVVEGTMVEERYRLVDGKPEKQDERSFGRGDITIAAGDSVHRINNRGEKHLVTVHIYSPPLGANMKLFTPIPRKAKV
jgi:predicted metal-dependent enzyme (double-stranded beta helix superfamily)